LYHCVKTGYVAVTVADAAKPNNQSVKATEPAPNKCSTDGHNVVLIQQIMAGPDTTETGDDNFSISMEAACCLLVR
jgi:hypothetical protein